MITASQPAAFFHFGLNISDLEQSVAFYRLLFDTEPLKSYRDYAKFELNDPPFVLSLLPNPQIAGGPLYHIGLRLPDSESLVTVQKRLEEAGIHTLREDGVECCYARQSKFWVRDPDRNLWELYVVEGDLDHHGSDAPPGFAVEEAEDDEPAVAAVWEHRFGKAFPQRINAADGTVDEVRFEGSWSMDVSPADCERILQEAVRVLKPGGSVLIHGLVAEREFPHGMPVLEGPIERLRRIPTEQECHDQLRQAGFHNLQFTKLSSSPCFVVDGVGLREMRLTGTRPAEESANSTGSGLTRVLYRGPFRSMTDDDGREYLCGQCVQVPARVAQGLQDGPHAESFLIGEALEA